LGKIKIKDLLEVMAPALVLNPPSTIGEEVDELNTGENLNNVVSLKEQIKVVEKVLPLVIGKRSEFISMPMPMSEEKEFEVDALPFFIMYVESEKWQGDEYFKCLHLKGFESFEDLKAYIECRNLSVIHIYVKDLNTYKEVRFKGYYDTDEHSWDDIEIPCLCEIEEIQFEKGKEFIIIPYIVGLFPSVSLVKEYIAFLIAEGYFEKDIKFMVEGNFNYEGKAYYYKMSSDGMTMKADYCLPYESN